MIVLDKILDLDSCLDSKTVITIGNFDGVHIGHRKLIKKTIDLAKKFSAKSLVFSFWPHTRQVLLNKDFKTIFNKYERREILKSLDINYLVEFDFNSQTKKIKTHEFIRLLIKKLNCIGLVLGNDFKFGCDNTKKVLDVYKNIYKNLILIKKLDDVFINKNIKVSSTYIRKLIKQKKFRPVEKLLCQKYFISAQPKKIFNKIIKFDLGLDLKKNKLLPPDGSYETNILINNQKYKAQTKIISQRYVLAKIFGHIKNNFKDKFKENACLLKIYF